MQNPDRFTAIAQHPTAAAVTPQWLQIVPVLLLGLSMLYVAGFLQTSEVHNAAHDMRHSIGFPCH